jgi:hypothetical protein
MNENIHKITEAEMKHINDETNKLVRFRKLAELTLLKSGSTSESRAKSSTDLLLYAKQMFPDFFESEVNKETLFLQYGLNRGKKTNPAIVSPGVKKGYYYDESKIIKDDEIDDISNKSPGRDSRKRPRIRREELLYPRLNTWLIENDYKSQEVANKRKLGKWGNPDLIGIQAFQSASGQFVETLSIEAKVNLDKWETWIFEAVSHKRFVNRVYFAYPVEGSNFVLNDDMRIYAEIYGIGILAMSLPPKEYKKLQNGKKLDEEEIEIIELFPAIFNLVRPLVQQQLWDSLGIVDWTDLVKWGEI